MDEKLVTVLGKKFKGISGSTIKLIAIITMLIDHTAATILDAIVYRQYEYQMEHNIFNANGYYPIFDSAVYKIDLIMRGIGRIAFPCFCFLLVEGFIHTRNRTKYAIRLALFALLSEIPFDLAFNKKIMDNSYQNVFFTLCIGFITITFLNAILYKQQLNIKIKIIFGILICAGGMALAVALKTDYDALGVFTIIIMYLLRNYKNAAMYGGCMALTIFQMNEAYAFIGMIPIAFYNGTRGLKLKYIFYIFYPAHLLILYAICKIFGLY